MRQLGDLAIWTAMIVLALGVVYYTPVVAEYMTRESKPVVAATPGRAPGMNHTMFRPPHALGDSRTSH